jgi:hypothetical protein
MAESWILLENSNTKVPGQMVNSKARGLSFSTTEKFTVVIGIKTPGRVKGHSSTMVERYT